MQGILQKVCSCIAVNRAEGRFNVDIVQMRNAFHICLHLLIKLLIFSIVGAAVLDIEVVGNTAYPVNICVGECRVIACKQRYKSVIGVVYRNSAVNVVYADMEYDFFCIELHFKRARHTAVIPVGNLSSAYADVFELFARRGQVSRQGIPYAVILPEFHIAVAREKHVYILLFDWRSVLCKFRVVGVGYRLVVGNSQSNCKRFNSDNKF